MFRVPIAPRANWQRQAAEFGFKFHTMYGQAYWDESAYYQFTLEQIERDLEQPTEALQQMCLEVVDVVVNDQQWLEAFRIPPLFWEQIRDSWQRRDPTLYSRLDFVYDGKSPAKLLENNADTPTSLYETGFWQWLWLEDNVRNKRLPRQSDQFNSLQEKLINRFADIAEHYGIAHMHFACCKDTEEDRGTVQYLQDCAEEAGLSSYFTYIEDIGLTADGEFTDSRDLGITSMFKLYPWEFMQRESFADAIKGANVNWLEPLWKSVLSNKALLPMLWKLFPGHPNLLPAYFENDVHLANESKLVKKPIFSREGANVSILEHGQEVLAADGPYGEEGFVYQTYHALPRFADSYALIGSWLIGNEAAGISVREDTSPITQDLSRYLPHIILG